MERSRAAAGLLFLVAAGAAFVLMRRDDPPVPPPPPPPAPSAPAPPPAPKRDPIDARVLRSRDEVIVFVRTTEFGLPASDAEVREIDAAGAVLHSGRTDGTGVYRGELVGGAVAVTIATKEGSIRRALSEAPPADSRPVAMLTDRTVLRPGDDLRIAAWREAPSSDPFRLALGFPPAMIPLEEVAPATGPMPCWFVLGARVPDDQPPGRARILLGDREVLAMDVIPRWGPATAPRPGTPDAPPPDSGELSLSDAEWRWTVPGAEEGTAALFVAVAGDRFLAHATATAGEGGFHAPLPIPAGERAVVRALATAAGGFREATSTAPAAGGGPSLSICLDAIPDRPPRVQVETNPAPPAPPDAPGPVAAMALAVEEISPRGGRAVVLAEPETCSIDAPLLSGHLRVRGLALGGALTAPITTEVEFPGTAENPRDDDEAGSPPPERTRVLLRPGRTATFPGRGRRLAPGATIAWTADAGPGEGSSFRLRADGGIVLAARAGSGVIDGAALVGRELLLESRAEAVEGLLLEAAVEPLPTDAPAQGEGLALSLELPADVAAGGEADASLRIRAETACGPTTVTLPLPNGVEPAWDGWKIRAAAPEGSRVAIPEGRTILWTIPALPRGETRLPLRLRFLRAGPAVFAASTVEPKAADGPWARSAAATIPVR